MRDLLAHILGLRRLRCLLLLELLTIRRIVLVLLI